MSPNKKVSKLSVLDALNHKSIDEPEYKHWKINEEDWRNRKKWEEHNGAAEDMFNKTSSHFAPWTVIGANYKWYARTKVLKTIVERLEKSIK